MRKIGLLLCVSCALVGCGGQRARIETYVDPALGTTLIRRVAVLPFQNSALTPSQCMEVNRNMIQALLKANPDVEVIGPSEAADAISEGGLSDEWARFLVNYETSALSVLDCRV